MENSSAHEAFKIIGPLVIPSYFGADTRDIQEAAMAIDEIRRGRYAVVDDIPCNDNLEDAIKVMRILGFNVRLIKTMYGLQRVQLHA